MFRTTNDGVPYYRPVAPEVPVADNTAAKIIAEGTGSLVSAFSRAALAREQNRIEEEDNLRKSDLAAQGLQLKAIDQANDYDLKKQLYSSYQTSADARLESAKKGVMALTTAADARRTYQDSINELDTNATKAADELKLNDAQFQTEDPVGWNAARLDFEKRYGAAAVGRVPQMIKQLKQQADQQTVPYIEGGVAEADSYARDYEKTPGKGSGLDYLVKNFQPGQVKGGKPVDVPIWQLHDRYQQADDEGKAAIAAGLMAAGSGHIVQSLQKVTDTQTETPGSISAFFGAKPKTIKTERTVPVTTEELNPRVKGALTREVKPSDAASQVPELLTRKLTDKQQALMGGDVIDRGTGGADQPNADTLPEPDLPPLQPGASISSPSGIAAPTSRAGVLVTPKFDPSKTSQTLAQARAVLGANPNARDEVMRRLQGLGIDPSLLDAA